MLTKKKIAKIVFDWFNIGWDVCGFRCCVARKWDGNVKFRRKAGWKRTGQKNAIARDSIGGGSSPLPVACWSDVVRLCHLRLGCARTSRRCSPGAAKALNVALCCSAARAFLIALASLPMLLFSRVAERGDEPNFLAYLLHRLLISWSRLAFDRRERLERQTPDINCAQTRFTSLFQSTR